MIHTIALTGIQLSQLLAINRGGVKEVGDILCKDALKKLRDHGFVTLLAGWYVLTGRGNELARHFTEMIDG